MKNRIPVTRLMIAGFLTVASGLANADVHVFTDRDSYLAAVGQTGTDSFDDLAPYSGFEILPQLDRTAGPFTYTAIATSDAFYAGGNGTDGWLGVNRPQDTMVLANFSGNGGGTIQGLGGYFFGTNAAGQYTQANYITFSVTEGAGPAGPGTTLTYTYELPTQTSFIGFVTDNALATVLVNGPVQDNTWLTANDIHLSVAAPVPEPEMFGMLLGGLALLGYVGRRAKK